MYDSKVALKRTPNLALSSDSKDDFSQTVVSCIEDNENKSGFSSVVPSGYKASGFADDSWNWDAIDNHVIISSYSEEDGDDECQVDPK